MNIDAGNDKSLRVFAAVILLCEVVVITTVECYYCYIKSCTKDPNCMDKSEAGDIADRVKSKIEVVQESKVTISFT